MPVPIVEFGAFSYGVGLYRVGEFFFPAPLPAIPLQVHTQTLYLCAPLRGGAVRLWAALCPIYPPCRPMRTRQGFALLVGCPTCPVALPVGVPH